MGSKTNGTPDEILRQNHQMLSAVHQGRSVKGYFNSLLCFLRIGLFCLCSFCQFISPKTLVSDSMEKAQASHVYSYRHGFRGFAARLTEEQVAAMASMLFIDSCLFLFF